jgi:glycine amidinotransferase
MKLNSYDEWSPLKEIVVGSAKNYTSHERELSFDLFFHDNIIRSEWYYPRLTSKGSSAAAQSAIKTRYVEELNEDIEGIVGTLQDLGVIVHRPMELDANTAEVTTLAWSASVVPPLNIRDNALILGDEIIETPPMVRSRYFETRFLQPVFNHYFRQGARWTTMPRPLLTDASFDLSYANANATGGGPTEPIEDLTPNAYDVGHEMMIDGAQCLRLGRDLIVNVSTSNHEMACDWLERHLEGRFNVHRVYRLSDSHIDSMVLALRPGMLLVRNEQVVDYLPEALRSWDMVIPPAPTHNSFPEYDEADLILTSPYIDLNVLSIDPDTVMVNDACLGLMETLDGLGFNVVPVRHRHRRLFGGGFHCFTLDTVRLGGPEDYLS